MNTTEPIALDDTETFVVVRGDQRIKVPFAELSHEELSAIYARSVDKVIKGTPTKRGKR